MEKKTIKSFKGFDKNLRCGRFQYKVGKSYEERNIEIYKHGFHACKNPFDVWNYYDMLGSRYCEVEQSGEIIKDESDTKICSSKIKIKAELKLADIINFGVEYIKDITSPKKNKGNSDKNDNRGYNAQICSSGDNAQIGSSGNYAQIGSSGYNAKIGSSGYNAKIGSSGYNAKIGSSGDNAQIGSSGNYAQIGSSGYNAKIGSSGYNAKIGSSGNYAKIGSSGYNAQIGSSGNYVQIGSSGDNAQIGSSGDNAKIGSLGQDSVIMCAGFNAKAKAKKGSWITLAEWKFDEDKVRYIPTCVKTEQVDGTRIKEDIFYKLENGEFKEAEA